MARHEFKKKTTAAHIPPKSGLSRMSYPFSSLSTVSFTKDMLPGSLTLEREKTDYLDVGVRQPGGNNLDLTKSQKLSPFRATYNRTDNQRGKDAELPNPVQSDHHTPISPVILASIQSREPSEISSRDGSRHRSEEIH